ncbi:XRE family transcriptional regulator [Sinorhizobium meliloti]|uniref:helix-turn-helix domain-containing protein n=1 Tax=Rhizobium meliloti TaxID=382 RepID=UPI000FD7C3A2|nr:helix-turn-helix transcriptional regulator [Sinorhizobium meliloti]RVH83395.1 XRE family transcriptional regulator [Sinorhizobium meliloti]RVJ58250.1 XRE family transcriptional regulator [Sinorhizobium meliloti]RVM31606.1 XRE family transcriptional regulator [Sinorhizobium meliloti]RVO04401.1 XRE family transcriptional regulator [Sinorhizobium meliloti]
MTSAKRKVGSRAESAAGKKREAEKHAELVELGKRIRYLRKEILGYHRQSDFAERLGVTRGAVGNWEIGVGMKRDHLITIAKEFNISHAWLAEGKGTPIAKPSIDSKLELLPPEEYETLYEHFQTMIDNRLRALGRKEQNDDEDSGPPDVQAGDYSKRREPNK